MASYKKLNQIQLYVDRNIPYTLDLNIGDKTDAPFDLSDCEYIYARVRESEDSPVVDEFEIIQNPNFFRQGRIVATLGCRNFARNLYYFDFVAVKQEKPIKLVSGQITVRSTFSLE